MYGNERKGVGRLVPLTKSPRKETLEVFDYYIVKLGFYGEVE